MLLLNMVFANFSPTWCRVLVFSDKWCSVFLFNSKTAFLSYGNGWWVRLLAFNVLSGLTRFFLFNDKRAFLSCGNGWWVLLLAFNVP
jgi:hypothetical protein